MVNQVKVTTETFETKRHLVKLTSEDLLVVKVHNYTVGMRWSPSRLCLEIFPLHEGERLDKEPTLTLGLAELEGLSEIVDYPVDFISLTFPAKLMPEVKKRLKDLPVVLPTVR